MRTLLITLAALLPLLFSTIATDCSSNPVQPPPPPPVEPDSTTQNFTFTTYEFGDGYSSSYLNDVWIFDENNIWAVGWISPADPANNTYHVGNPNIVIWDGVKWNVPNYSGTSSGMYGIWAADSGNIYFAIGAIVKYQYGRFIEMDLGNLGFTNGQAITKLWGSSTSNIWGVGPWGTIVHYDGSNWSKIDFDQQWTFTAVTGNVETGIAYAVGRDTNFRPIILKLYSNSPEIIYQPNTQATELKSYGIKYLNGLLYLAGSDFSSTLLWEFNPDTKKIDSLYALAPTTSILETTGERPIDLYLWGRDYTSGKMIHYNGKRYKIFDLPEYPLTQAGADTKGDFSAFVSNNNNKGFITIVKRILQ